ncbi:MAG TPA: hypothetical protein VFP06_18135, partial [Acidimicrobiales bacterium]|nr:hypothetical protein [Acidimicrobiales bacterium]
MTVRTLLVAVVLVVCGACGVRTDDEARVAGPDEVPFGLLDPDRQATAGDVPAGSTVAEVYLFADEEATL